MKKIIILLLSAACVICGALGIAACVPAGLNAHNWSHEWSHSFTEHWHVCTDAGCNGRTSVGEHDWRLVESMVEEQPTCGNAGWGRYVCIWCGATKDDDVPPTGEHDYERLITAVEATCVDDGQELWLCKTCGNVESRAIPATGKHSYDTEKWEYDETGHYHVCSECGQRDQTVPHLTKEEIAAKGGKNVTTVQPNSSNPADGYTSYKCDCGYEVEREVIPNPYIASTFEIQLVRNFDGKTMPITDLGDETDVYGNKILHTYVWAEGSFPSESADGLSRRYRLTIINGRTASGTAAPVYYDGMYSVEAFISDPGTGKETPLSGTALASGYVWAKVDSATGTYFTFGVYNYDTFNAKNNEQDLVLRYYTIVGGKKQLRAERTLNISILRYGETEHTPAAVAYLPKKREDI